MTSSICGWPPATIYSIKLKLSILIRTFNNDDDNLKHTHTHTHKDCNEIMKHSFQGTDVFFLLACPNQISKKNTRKMSRSFTNYQHNHHHHHHSHSLSSSWPSLLLHRVFVCVCVACVYLNFFFFYVTSNHQSMMMIICNRAHNQFI